MTDSIAGQAGAAGRPGKRERLMTLAFIDAHHRSPKTRPNAFVREFTA